MASTLDSLEVPELLIRASPFRTGSGSEIGLVQKSMFAQKLAADFEEIHIGPDTSLNGIHLHFWFEKYSFEY